MKIDTFFVLNQIVDYKFATNQSPTFLATARILSCGHNQFKTSKLEFSLKLYLQKF